MQGRVTRAALVALLVGCGGAQEPEEQPLTAPEHERAAHEHEREAEAHEAEYDPYAATSGSHVHANAVYGTDRYNPTARELEAAQEHREHAAEHRARADELRRFRDIACSHFPNETRASCPLLLGYTSAEDIEGGIRIVFPREVDREAAAEHIRCHIAFIEAHGREGVDHCALYVPGVTLRVDEDAIVLVTSDATQVEDLRRRVRQQTG